MTVHMRTCTHLLIVHVYCPQILAHSILFKDGNMLFDDYAKTILLKLITK